jgi:hypothetical protein
LAAVAVDIVVSFDFGKCSKDSFRSGCENRKRVRV